MTDSRTALRQQVGTSAFIGTFGTSAFIQGCTLLQGVLLARILGPIGRGEFATVILWPMVFAGFGLLGVNTAIGRRAAIADDAGALGRCALVLALTSGAISALACYLSLPFLLPGNEAPLLSLSRFFILFIPINYLALNLAAVDQGAAKFLRLNVTRALLNPINVAGFAFLFILGSQNIGFFVFVVLFSNSVVSLIRIALVLKDYGLRGTVAPRLEVLREGIPFGMANIGQLCTQNVDKILLLWLLGARGLGVYVVAISAANVLNTVANSMGMVVFTIAAQAPQRKGFDRIAGPFRKAVLISALGGAVLALGMPTLLPMVYSIAFAEAVVPAMLLIPGAVFAGLASLLEQAMRGQGRAFVGLEARLAATFIMVAVGGFSTGAYGVTGMCLAVVCAQFTCLCVLTARTRLHYGRPEISKLVPTFADLGHSCFKCVSYVTRSR